MINERSPLLMLWLNYEVTPRSSRKLSWFKGFKVKKSLVQVGAKVCRGRVSKCFRVFQSLVGCKRSLKICLRSCRVQISFDQNCGSSTGFCRSRHHSQRTLSTLLLKQLLRFRSLRGAGNLCPQSKTVSRKKTQATRTKSDKVQFWLQPRRLWS